MLKVYLVSDATGGAAERLVRSAIVQFKDADVRLTRRPSVLTSEQVRAVVREAADSDSLIVHTLVSDELLRYNNQSRPCQKSYLWTYLYLGRSS